MVLDRVGVVGRAEQLLVAAVEPAGVPVDAVGDVLSVEQAAQPLDVVIVQLGHRPIIARCAAGRRRRDSAIVPLDETPTVRSGRERYCRSVRTFSDLFRNVMQVAYVTDDLEVACEYFEQTLGTVPCTKTYKSSLGGIVVVDGETAEEWVMDVALVNAGPTNFELIQPVSGAVDLYRAAIRPGAPATFHHVGYRIDDFDEATDDHRRPPASRGSSTAR